MNYENEEMEMPTPCTHCGEIFDLNDGFGSEKWYPNTVICKSCYEKEKEEIEDDDHWETINIDLTNALYGLDKKENLKDKLDKNNLELLTKIFPLITPNTIGTQLISAERQKQIDKHGFTAEHHFNNPHWYEADQLQEAAVTLLLQDLMPHDLVSQVPDNWDADWFANLMDRTKKERLIIAGAMISAELDRLDFIEHNSQL